MPEPLFDGHLGLADVDVFTTRNLVDGAVTVAFAPTQALTVLTDTI